MVGLLIAISAAGASSVDVDFDTLRRWLVDGLVPVVVVAGQNMVRSVEVGISLRTAAIELAGPVDTVVSLLRAGDLKPLPLPGEPRLRQADVEAFVRKLTPLPMTDELRESIWPSVEEYVGSVPAPAFDYLDSLRQDDRRQSAKVAALRREFFSTLPPSPKPSAIDGNTETVDVTQLLSPEAEEGLWQAFLARKRAREEAERYDRLHSHNLRGY